MNRMMSCAWVVLVALMAFVPSSLAGDAPKEAGKTYKKFKFENNLFIIEGDADENFGKRVAQGVVNMADFFVKTFRIPKADIYDDTFTGKAHIYIHKDYEEFIKILQERYKTKARYVRAYYGQFFNDESADGGKDNRGKGREYRRECRTFLREGEPSDEVYSALVHELGHMFMCIYTRNFNLEAVPSWIQEGVAMLFQYMPGVGIKTDKDRLRNKAIIYEGVRNGDACTFLELKAIKNIDNLGYAATDAAKMSMHYAQAWTVMFYMTTIEGDRFSVFMKELKRGYGMNSDAAFKKAFSGYTFEDMEKPWRRYVETKYKEELDRKPLGYYFIGSYYFMKNRVRPDEKNLVKAKEYFEMAVARDPNIPEAHMGIGQLRYAKGDMDGALASLKKAVDLDPKLDDAHYLVGDILVRKSDYAGAVEAFEKAVAVNSGFWQAYHRLGEAALYNREFSRAIKALERATFLMAEDWGGYYLKGLAHYHKGEKDQALMEFRRVDMNTNGAHEPSKKAIEALTKGGDLEPLPAKETPKEPKKEPEPPTEKDPGKAPAEPLKK
ncbi:MAG: tetratricopeptide repeat protein [Planctomycetota bacterium]